MLREYLEKKLRETKELLDLLNLKHTYNDIPKTALTFKTEISQCQCQQHQPHFGTLCHRNECNLGNDSAKFLERSFPFLQYNSPPLRILNHYQNMPSLAQDMQCSWHNVATELHFATVKWVEYRNVDEQSATMLGKYLPPLAIPSEVLGTRYVVASFCLTQGRIASGAGRNISFVWNDATYSDCSELN